MKKEDCQIGMLVFDEDGPEWRYEVTSLPDDDGMVELRSTKNPTLDRTCNVKYLFVYDEELFKKVAAELQARVDKAKSAFEVAFEELHAIRHYYDEETGLSHYGLRELGLLNLEELEATFDNGGWSSSSLWC